MSVDSTAEQNRQTMEADIVCVGFGPAAGGFLTELTRELAQDGGATLQSSVMPGMPLQVICYERADDVGFGVSGVVSRARAIRTSFPELNPADVPMAAEVSHEEVLYLLDPGKASRRSALVRFADTALRLLGPVLPLKDHAFKLPYIPPFLRKEPGLTFSLGQFTQWAAGQVMGSGMAQIWPGMPVAAPLFEGERVCGVRLLDQGTDLSGAPGDGYMPGMDIRAALTVVADGPVGAVGQALNRKFGLPPGNEQFEWAVGAKMVVELAPGSGLKPGTVLHTFGYPEPEIFGFLYVHPDNLASLGIFVPSTFGSPARTSYRYLQQWMKHPALAGYLAGAELRSWGAKSLLESGRRGEPYLAGDGYARIGEGSGSTNMLTGSGVDEAWATGVQLAQAVCELVRAGKPFTKANLEAAYVKRRRESWVEQEGRIAEKARDGFASGFSAGMLGMALAGFSKGRLGWPVKLKPPHERLQSLEQFYAGRISSVEIERIRRESRERGEPLHDALMDRVGFEPIALDGKLFVSLQDALLVGGKVQAAHGYANHVVFTHPEVCSDCGDKLCIEVCSGQAIYPGVNGVPAFDREKCVHCGACLWNCSRPGPDKTRLGNIDFRSGSGGLHSSQN